MAAKIQAETTPIKKAAVSRRAIIIVLAVLILHAVMLTALATLTPTPLHRSEPPQPIAVRFVQVTPAKPIEPPKPKQDKPQQQKVLPKKTVKPKEVNVVKPKPVPKPKPMLKPKPVLTTNTTSTHKQQVVLPLVTTEETKSKPEPEAQLKTKPEPDTESKPDTSAQQSTPAAPVLVEGVSYIKPPRLNITERDLKGEARTVKLRITIGANGKVEAVQVVSSSGITSLDQKVASALKKATFTPHRINGVAVPVYTVQPFELNLPK